MTAGKIVAGLSIFLATGSALATWIIPGPWRVMMPTVFGLNDSNAFSFGEQVTYIPSRAMSDPHLGEIMVAHERTHSGLHARLGWYGLLTGKLPLWFNEGLATHISGDDRMAAEYPQQDMEWISHARGLFSWGEFVRERGWKTAYGAAASAVAMIRRQSGDEGLRALIDQAASGSSIDRQLAGIVLQARETLPSGKP